MADKSNPIRETNQEAIDLARGLVRKAKYGALAFTDPQTGAMRAEFVPDNTVGEAGDKLHPNRLGYMAMGAVIDLKLLAPWR